MGIFDFAGLRRQVASLSAQFKELQAKEEQLRRQRDAIAAAPLARADVKRLLDTFVDSTGAAFTAGIEGQLKALITGSTAIGRQPRLANFTVAGALSPYGTAAPGQAELDAAICALAGPALKAALGQVVDVMPWPGSEGLPWAERSKRMAELDEQLAALVAEQANIERQAEEAGIRL